MKYKINLFPTEEDVLRIRRRLQDYNSSYFEIDDEHKFIISVIDDCNELIGGIACTIVGQWLEIAFLWVKEDQRKKGIGKKLLFEAEEIGKKNKCTKAFLTTMNFQAKPFYLKYGYKIVYVQRGYPLINEKYFMGKSLV